METKTINGPEELHQTLADLFGDVIYSYTRAQAIADGVLVDMTQGELGALLREVGFNRHTVMTATAFGKVIQSPGADLPAGQDIQGRWWDVLNGMKAAILAAIRKNPAECDNVPFQVRAWNGRTHETVRMYVNCGPGDNGEPVLTIMLEGED